MVDYPVIFIHGLLGTLQNADICTAFATDRTLAPDLLGYGHMRGVSPESITIAAQINRVHTAITDWIGHQRVHLVGHSAGGVVAYLFAHQYPELVASVVSVEGNFTLRDAFWSASVARMSVDDAEMMLRTFQTAPGEWLAKDKIPAEPHYIKTARHWLSYQPGSTIRAMGRAMGRAVVETTSDPEYLRSLRTVFDSLPVHLLAGERSRDAWDTPDWALQRAASVTVMPRVGHLMMLEDPTRFGDIVSGLLGGHEASLPD